MSEHICEKCKWHKNSEYDGPMLRASFGFCVWSKHHDVPATVAASLFDIQTEIVSCPTFEPREENSCLNCKHAAFGDEEFGCCTYDQAVVPGAWHVSIDFISKSDPHTNCPTWEAK